MWSVDRFHFPPSRVLVLIENVEQLKYLQVEIEWRKKATAAQALENKGMTVGVGKALGNKGMTAGVDKAGAGKVVNKNAKSGSTNWQKELKLWYKKLKVDKQEAKSFNIFCNMPGAERFSDL